MNTTFEEYIKERCFQNEKGLDIISINEVIGAWWEYMTTLREIYTISNENMEQAGIMIKNKLKEWKIL